MDNATTAPQDAPQSVESTASPAIKRKPGRPVGSHAPPHFTAWLRLRISERHLAACNVAAELEGIPLSQWVRNALDAQLGPYSAPNEENTR